MWAAENQEWRVCRVTEEGKLRHDLHEAIMDHDVAKTKVLSRALWRIIRRKQREDANNMILEAGAVGCNPMDRRTRYVDVSAILGDEDTIGVLTDHFRDIYTSAPGERNMNRELQEGLLIHYIDPRTESDTRVLPLKTTFKVCENKEQLAITPEPFDKWVIYTDGECRENNVAGNIAAGWVVLLSVHRFGVEHEFMRLHGPVVLNPASNNWIGAQRATNNTGELPAMIEALIWINQEAPDDCGHDVE